MPTVTAIEPATGSADGGTTVTITGTDLSNISSITFGDKPVSWTALSDTSVSVTAPGGVGVVDIVVTTPGGSNALTEADRFTWVPNTLTALALSSDRVPGGISVRGVVTVTYPAPATGIRVTLHWRRTSENRDVAVFPISAFVPAGSTEGSFVGSTYYVSAPVQIDLTAEHWGEQHATLTVEPPTSSR